MKEIKELEKSQLKKVPNLRPGDTVRVHTKIIEGNKERIQIFEGVVLRVSGSGLGASFVVRKISYGVGVERVFLLQSPRIAKIQVVKRAKVRQAYLTYLRHLRGKKAKLTEKQFDSLAVNIKEEELKPADLAPPAKDEKAEDEELDKEITEIDAGEAEAVKGEESAEELAEEELGSQEPESDTEDEQEIAAVEVDEGVDLAETDIEKGESREGEHAEKVVEDVDDSNLPEDEIDSGTNNKESR